MENSRTSGAICAVFALAVATLVACGGGGGASGGHGILPSGSPPPSHPSNQPSQPPIIDTPFPSPGPSAATVIQHIVLVIQENRSFDNLFQGYPGADTSSTGKTHLGEVVTLTQDPLEAPYDVEHLRDQAVGDIDLGKMDGFDNQPYYPEHPTPPGYTYPPNPAYVYVPPSETKPYVAMAQQNVLADKFFSSQADGSFVAHQYLVAGQAGNTYSLPAGYPWGCDAPAGTLVDLLDAYGHDTKNGIFPCFTYTSLGDELDAKNIPWRAYDSTEDSGYA